MNNDALEKILSANLARINEWLRFAETKNAALLTFSSAWLLAISSLWSNVATPAIIRLPLLVAGGPILASAFTALISLLPQNQTKKSSTTARELTTENLLFHGNLSNIELSSATTTLSNRYKCVGAEKVSIRYINDLSTQLIETSIIAQRKFKLFSRGAALIMLGFGAATLTLLILIIASFGS